MKICNWLLMVLLIGACSACSQFAEPQAPNSEFEILITVSQMVGEEETSRTYGSMTPDRENSIKTLSVFQFDTEGNLRTISNGKRYIFKSFTGLGDPNGIPRVTNTEMPELDNLLSSKKMHTCLIANLPNSAELEERLFVNGEDNPINWTEFQEASFDLPFAGRQDIDRDPTLEPGHLTTTYMFGYYEGVVPSDGFTIALGRILTRLQITFNVDAINVGNDTITSDVRYYAAIDNLETHAYFSVAEDSPHEHYPDAVPSELDRSRFSLTPYSVNAGKNILQFYCAPHVGNRITKDSCTTLYLWCVRATEPHPENLDKSQAIKVPLCADYDNGQYHLARNTFYSFNVRLLPSSSEGGGSEGDGSEGGGSEGGG